MNNRHDVPPLGLTKIQAMALLNCSSATLSRLLAAGKLTARKAGSRTIIEAESVEKYWDSLPRAEYRAPAVAA